MVKAPSAKMTIRRMANLLLIIAAYYSNYTEIFLSASSFAGVGSGRL